MSARKPLEELDRNPELVILPSGDVVSLWGIQSAHVVKPGSHELETWRCEEGNLLICYHRGIDSPFVVDNPVDVAALRAALHHIGVPINAPTIKGDDADGDGVAGE